MRLGCIEAFRFEWFCLHYSLYSTLLLVNFSWIVSANGCKLVGPDHLNFGILYGCVIFYSALFYFFGDLGFAFVTTNQFPVKQQTILTGGASPRAITMVLIFNEISSDIGSFHQHNIRQDDNIT